MCLSVCHRRWVLFWNHEDCDIRDCEFAAGPHGRCATCRHAQAGRCTLTNAALPAGGGCCHHNVEPVSGPVAVSWRMLAPLRPRPEEMVEQLLADYDVPYRHGPQLEVLVDPDDLGLPLTFGVGTEPLLDKDFDWSEWTAQWDLDDVAVVDEPLSGEFPQIDEVPT